MTIKNECKVCSNKGLFAPACPSCVIPAFKKPWIVVERCDSCELFSDDLLAAQSLYDVAGWFPCADGGFHALADSRTLRDQQ